MLHICSIQINKTDILGVTSLIWCVIFYFLVFKSPDDHPRISKEERIYLKQNSNATKTANMRDIKIPVKEMAMSIPVHALWIVHFASGWIIYLIAINLPLFINETFNLGIVMVSKHHQPYLYHSLFGINS